MDNGDDGGIGGQKLTYQQKLDMIAQIHKPDSEDPTRARCSVCCFPLGGKRAYPCPTIRITQS